jgi:hypothetical protein
MSATIEKEMVSIEVVIFNQMSRDDLKSTCKIPDQTSLALIKPEVNFSISKHKIINLII